VENGTLGPSGNRAVARSGFVAQPVTGQVLRSANGPSTWPAPHLRRPPRRPADPAPRPSCGSGLVAYLTTVRIKSGAVLGELEPIRLHLDERPASIEIPSCTEHAWSPDATSSASRASSSRLATAARTSRESGGCRSSPDPRPRRPDSQVPHSRSSWSN